MSESKALTPASFPPEIHESLAQLRAVAKRVRSREEWDRLGRRATEEEQLLAKSLLPPNACGRPSQRSLLPCERKKMAGGDCCFRHGGSLPSTRRAAERRLRASADKVVESLIENATQTQNRAAAVKAGEIVLTKAGVGADIRSKIRSSQKSETGRIVVNIGFLQQPDGRPTTVTVSGKPEGESA